MRGHRGTHATRAAGAGREQAPDQRVSSWGGEDSNLRPTDYESAIWEGADLQELLELLVRSIP